MPLRVRCAIPANGIKTVDEKIVKKKCFELLLNGFDIYYTSNENDIDIEYFVSDMGENNIRENIEYPFKVLIINNLT